LAIASTWQGARYGAELFDFDVYAVAGDGCFMEGVSNEAASIAGHLKLDNLCWIYDNNHITIDGKTRLAYEDDVAARFIGYGWNVTRVGDANDTELLGRAFEEFRGEQGRPTLVIVDSHIGWGSPHKQDTAAAHGEPLGEEEVRETKRAYGWPEDAQFLVPDGVREHFAAGIGRRGAEACAGWEAKLAAYAGENAELAAEIEATQKRALPDGWDAEIPSFEPDEKGLATRKASHKVENAIAARVPWLLAGSADLTDSTSVRLDLDGAADFEPGAYDGRQLHYGIREHEAAAISNGLSLSKLRPLWSTYLTFSDYARPAIRLSALMELPAIHLFTHDSIGLGEDGPTHQPVEQLASLRAIPGLDVIRPADANEVAEAWRVAIDRTHQPVALVLTRQSVPILDRSRYAPAAGLRRGGYVLADSEGAEPEVILIATGSEVALALAAHEELSGEGIRSRVVSLPCWELFERQDDAYRDEVLPPGVTARVSVEEASTLGWDRYVGPGGVKIGMHTFGTSAPLKDVQDKFGFTPDRVAEAAKELLS
jgi:transketolase